GSGRRPTRHETGILRRHTAAVLFGAAVIRLLCCGCTHVSRAPRIETPRGATNAPAGSPGSRRNQQTRSARMVDRGVFHCHDATTFSPTYGRAHHRPITNY